MSVSADDLPYMTFIQACFLFFSAWLSGVLNSVAGGGGLIIFPALLLTGLSPINANATSTLASSTGYIASVAAYHNKLPAQQQLSWLLGGVSVIGGLLGAVLLLYTPTGTFNQLVPYLMLIATLLFTFARSIEILLKIAPETSQNSRSFLLKAAIIQFFISVYGGFYGLGLSFLMLATLSLLGIRDIYQINALKVLMMLCIDSFAIITFVVVGVIAWQQAVLMMVGTAIGGYSGAYYTRQLKPESVRRFIIVIAWGITSYFFFSK
ncbi:MAG: sulfite exporter TauE/SafE family protein [Nostoc sp.]|uniref:sulfite exporter TauE/SafE family protein n=1 Tax=Nostoc sp. TaxID=1180 RepID=UPI002FFCA7DC